MNIWELTLQVAMAAGVTLVFAALGEVIAERAGVLNLGVEGMMLMGAVTGFMAMNSTGSLAVGVIVALAAGAGMGLLHAFLTVSLRASQIVAGLALTIFGTGLSAYIGRNVVGTPAEHSFNSISIPGLHSIPWLGPILFEQNLLVYVCYGLVAAAWIVLFRLRLGLHLRAVGESAGTADAMGVRVVVMRYGAAATGGALAGLAGAYLSLARSPGWSEGMTAGRGWIAIGLVIFARWSPLGAIAGGFLFGFMEALNFEAQAIGITISADLLSMLPYLFTILAVVVAAVAGGRRLGAPAGLGIPYDREQR